MPTYDYMCKNDHHVEHFCSISAKPETLPCPECPEPMKPVILTAPHQWKNLYVLDFPGSKALKAGYVHSHGDPGVRRVSSGAGGMLNPKAAPLHPLANNVIPDPPKRSG